MDSGQQLNYAQPGRLASYYGVTIDELIHYSNASPKAVTVEDKTASEKVRLIAQLNEKDW